LKLKLKDDEEKDRRRIRRGGKKNKEKRRIKNKEYRIENKGNNQNKKNIE